VAARSRAAQFIAGKAVTPSANVLPPSTLVISRRVRCKREVWPGSGPSHEGCQLASIFRVQ
jgi:hypothetical protein